MSSFQLNEYIERPPHDVFVVLSDPSKASAFLDNISESIQLTDGPIGVGTRFRETRIVGGKQSAAELVVTAYEPDSHVGIGTEAEGITVVYHYRLNADGEGTHIEWTCDLNATGMRKIMLPVVSAIMKKEDGDHLQKLKAYLERTA